MYHVDFAGILNQFLVYSVLLDTFYPVFTCLALSFTLAAVFIDPT